MVHSRRTFIGSSVVIGAGLAMPAMAALQRTRPMTLGPFYPVAHGGEVDMDMTQIAGRPGRAKGEIIEVAGRVLDPSGKPVPGARIDIWQANAAGRYAHKGDISDKPLDPDFQGLAILKADAEGRYRVRTVRPGVYPAGRLGFNRAAHIHFSVDGQHDRLVTQMYFADDKWLAQDKVLLADLDGRGAPWPDAIFGQKSAGTNGAAAYGFDIVLAVG